MATQLRRDAAWLAKRVSDLRTSRGWTQLKLAADAGVSAGAISLIERAETEKPNDRTLDAIARALGFRDGAGLLSGEDPPAVTQRSPFEPNVRGRVEDLRAPGVQPLPIYRWGAAGDPRSAQNAPDPDRLDYPPLGRELLIGPRGFGIEVKGESMAGRDIHDGDVVWCNPDRAFRVGGVVLARIWDLDGQDSGMVVKRVISTPIGERLASEGDTNEGPMGMDGQRYEIVGPVVWITRGFPPG